MDSLQKKLKDLEEENVALRSEVKHPVLALLEVSGSVCLTREGHCVTVLAWKAPV